MLTWYVICASSHYHSTNHPLKPLQILPTSPNVFLPFSVFGNFYHLSFTFWHRIHFSSFSLHFVASFSWTPGDIKLMFVFVYQFSCSPKSKSHDKYKIKKKLVSKVQAWHPETQLLRTLCIHQY